MDTRTSKFPLLLDSFWLKIIALLTMTLDHIGHTFYITPLQYIGRIAMPLFCFLIAEGVLHTKSFKKYALRLGIMASFISLVVLLSDVIPYFEDNGYSMRREGVIFIDLLLGALAVYLLRQDKWYIKALAVLPFAYGVASYFASSIECVGCGIKIHWFPFFLRTQYGWFGITLIIGFYLAHLFASAFFKNRSTLTGIDPETYKDTYIERLALNLISILILIVLSTINYFGGYLMTMNYGTTVLYYVQVYSVIAGAFILLYNGKRGYNGKWFQYGSYLYYPLHLLVIGIIEFIVYSI